MLKKGNKESFSFVTKKHTREKKNAVQVFSKQWNIAEDARNYETEWGPDRMHV